MNFILWLGSLEYYKLETEKICDGTKITIKDLLQEHTYLYDGGGGRFFIFSLVVGEIVPKVRILLEDLNETLSLSGVVSKLLIF